MPLTNIATSSSPPPTHTHTHTQLVSLRHHLLLTCSESETLTHLYKQQLASLDLEECHAHLRCVPFDLSARLPGNKDLDYFMAQAREGRSSDSRLDRWREGGREEEEGGREGRGREKEGKEEGGRGKGKWVGLCMENECLNCKKDLLGMNFNTVCQSPCGT